MTVDGVLLTLECTNIPEDRDVGIWGGLYVNSFNGVETPDYPFTTGKDAAAEMIRNLGITSFSFDVLCHLAEDIFSDFNFPSGYLASAD